jgi:hypothetical protein
MVLRWLSVATTARRPNAWRSSRAGRPRRDRYGFSYLFVADVDMDAFAPVVERLAGR